MSILVVNLYLERCFIFLLDYVKTRMEITMQNQDVLHHALVVKLVDTKDVKAEGFTSESVRGSLT